MNSCKCERSHPTRRVVITGGPGAGKTALLELIRHSICRHVVILPEAAGIVFGGGFPRGRTPVVREAAQRAIFQVQRELEAAGASGHPALVLCDRGTIDGATFWPGSSAGFWNAVGTTQSAELAGYHAVIHLRTPTPESGFTTIPTRCALRVGPRLSPSIKRSRGCGPRIRGGIWLRARPISSTRRRGRSPFCARWSRSAALKAPKLPTQVGRQ